MEEFYKLILLEEAQKMVSENESNSDFIILDVRTPQEFQGGVIGNAINVDFYGSDFAEKVGEFDKEKTYLVYCRSGARSKAATGLMKQSGFKKIYEVSGGILG